MENNFIAFDKAEYDNRRFPKKWQAMLGCALMQVFAYVVVFGLILVLGVNYQSWFKTTFGLDMFLTVVSQMFAILIIPITILSIGKKDFFATVRMKKSIDFIQIFLLFFVSIGIFFAAQGINGLFVLRLDEMFGTHSDAAEIEGASNISQLIFEFVIVAVLPAFCEEIFFRGMVMRSYERTSPISGVIVSAIAFSLMHGNATQFVYAFLIGLILGTVTMVSDSLFAGAAIHFFLNALSVFISYPPIYAFFTDISVNYTFVFVIFAYVLLPIACILNLGMFIVYSMRKNNEKYGKLFVSDMDNVRFMKKQSVGENFATVICWGAFVIINLTSAVISWKGTI